jgi:hypothetical protein
VSDDVRSEGEGPSVSDRAKSVAEQIVVPAVAAVASAAAGYIARRAPKLVEERLWPAFETKVLPRLREAGSARDLAHDMTTRAKEVVETHTPDHVPLVGRDGDAGEPAPARPAKRLSTAERERERAARANRRNERRRGTSS